MTRHNTAGIAGSEYHTGRFDGDVGTGTDGETDIGSRQGRRIVDTVTDHCHGQSSGLQLGNLCVFVFRQHFGHDLVDAELLSDRLRHLLSIAGDHDDTTAELVQFTDGLSGLGANLVFEREGPDDASPSTR